MRKVYRQLTQLQDPYVDLVFSQPLYSQLENQAVYNAREVRAEIIARLSQVLHYQYDQIAREEKVELARSVR